MSRPFLFGPHARVVQRVVSFLSRRDQGHTSPPLAFLCNQSSGWVLVVAVRVVQPSWESPSKVLRSSRVRACPWGRLKVLVLLVVLVLGSYGGKQGPVKNP